jgi:hypothetical protein
MLDSVGGAVVYNKTFDMNYTVILDLYEYFFKPFDYLDSVIITDLPPYPDGVINITASTDLSGAFIKIGSCVYGTTSLIGDTQYGVTFGIKDYSLKETDEFGNTSFVARAFSKRMEPSVILKNTDIRAVTNILNSIRARPTVWLGTDIDDYSPLVVFGFYRDYNIDVSYPTSSLLRLEIEGLV